MQPHWYRRSLRWIKPVANGFVWCCVAGAFVWSVGACYYFTLLSPLLRYLLAACYAGVVLACWIGARKHRHQLVGVRGWVAASAVGVYCLSLLIRPSNDRDWVDQQRYLPIARIDQNQVELQHFRHCMYRSETDYDVQLEQLTFDRRKLESAWLIIQHFSVFDGIAHTFISFGYRDEADQPQYFSVSAEIRREVGESFSPIRGLYRQFEMTLVVGDERDLIGCRTVLRPHDRVYLYRINANAEKVQQLFDQFAAQMQKLETTPQFYNTITNNCTNSIVRRTYSITPDPINWLNPRIALPGHSASLAFDLGLIGDRAGGQTLQQLYDDARIDEIARDIGFADDFSARIRQRH